VAENVEESTFLGKYIETVPLYTNVMEESGKFIFYDKGFRIIHKNEDFKAPYSYITNIERIGGMTLGRVKVRLVAYDMFGNKYDMNVVMTETGYVKLKRFVENSEKDI